MWFGSNTIFEKEGLFLATIYFKKDLSNLAKNLISVKGTVDKVKAFDDMLQIDNILSSYVNGQGYHRTTAEQLDERIRREYPIINKFNRLSTPQTTASSNTPSTVDPLISRLNQDQYGIQFEVLLKEKLVHDLEDFIDHLE